MLHDLMNTAATATWKQLLKVYVYFMVAKKVSYRNLIKSYYNCQ